ncbi:MAG: heme exporter protein CcmB [Myxococcota bacterium]
MRILAAILWKDLVTEWRSRDRVVAMLVFSLLVVMVFHFALPQGTGKQIAIHAPGLLWVAFVFAALIGLNRAFAMELENDALAGLALAPLDRGWVFLGKAISNVLLIGITQVLTAAAFAFVFDLDLLSSAGSLGLIFLLGTLGISSVGTLFAAMAARTRFREVLLPILLLPALFPVLAGAVEGTMEAIRDGTASFASIQLLLVVDGIYWIICFIGFEFVLDE